MAALPSLPTDNLYKFMALGGIALYLGTLAIVETKVAQGLDRVNTLRIEAAALNVEREVLKEDLARLRVDRADSSRASELVSKSVALRKRIAIASVQSEIMQQLVADVRRAYLQVLIVGSLGLGCSASGFSLWYRRHQRYLDRAIQAGAA